MGAALEAEVDYVCQILHRCGATRAELDDLVQEVFLVLLRRRDSYDPRRPLRPWIAGIAVKTMQETRRRTWRELPRGFVDAPDEGPRPEQQLASVQERSLVRAALDRLPEKQRAVLVLHELEGMSMRDIAEAGTTPLFTLYSRLRKARMTFAKELRRAQALETNGRTAKPSDSAVLLALVADPVAVSERTRRRALAQLRVRPLPAAGSSSWPIGPSALIGSTVLAAACLLLVLGLMGPGSSVQPAAAHAAAASATPADTGWSRTRTGPLRPGQASLVSLAPPSIVTSALLDPSPAALGRGLVGYWRFDDGPGSTSARDFSGGANHCLLRRLDPERVWERGALAGALDLGARGWLECPRVQALERIEDEMTIAAWVSRGTAFSNYRALVARQKDAGRQDELMFGFANGQLMFSSHSWLGKLMVELPPNLPRWFHVGVTRHADGTAILYVEGSELGRMLTGPGRLGRGDNPLLIGAAINGPDQSRTHARFDGQIDEVLIYARALGATEMEALAARRQPAPAF